MSEGFDISNCVLYSAPELGAGELAAIARIKDLRRQLRYSVAEPQRWLGPVRKVIAAKAIQGSNSIEGFNVSDDEAAAAVAGIEPEGDSPAQSIKAVQSYQRAMTYVLQLAKDEHFVYEASVIRSLHFMMTEYDLDASPGRWRPGPIWVRNSVSGDVVYEAPESDDVPRLVGCLMDELQTSNAPTMVKAAMAHLNLVMIHPFRDGNGRMSRCLQTLVLAREGILVPEFCSIEEFLGRNTQWYYQVLAETGGGSWQPTNDTTSWIRFCLVAHYVQAASVLRRIKETEVIWELLEEEIVKNGLPPRSIEALYDATLGLRVRNASYRSAVGSRGEDLSNQSATNDFKKMTDAGLLEKQGAKRGSYYVAGAPLVAIRNQRRAERQPIAFDDLFDDGSQARLNFPG